MEYYNSEEADFTRQNSRGPIAEFARKVHELSRKQGYWADGYNLQTFTRQMLNLVGEVSELNEAFRRGNDLNPCDKPVDLTYCEEELADILIRTLDLAQAMGVNIERAIIIKHGYNQERSDIKKY